MEPGHRHPEHRHTERLCLREPAAADLDAVHRIHADPATNVYNPAGPVQDLAQTSAMLDDWRQAWTETGYAYWAVRESCDGPVIGIAGILPRTVDGIAVFNLYYRFAPEAWGRGYAAETARAALELAALQAARPMIAVCHEDNLASRRVAETVGMVAAGTVLHNGTPRLVYESPKSPSFEARRRGRPHHHQA